jgi:hypothetical protein
MWGLPRGIRAALKADYLVSAIIIQMNAVTQVPAVPSTATNVAKSVNIIAVASAEKPMKPASWAI